jgi:flagellar basal-body rod protein FlgC
MAFDNFLVSGNISASGMSAERTRMDVTAQNIANALSTRAGPNGVYRRQNVVCETVMNDQLRGPGHPDADQDGFVTMPNVSLPMEMINLMTASRAYEANLKVLQTLRQQMEQTLNLIRY